ncbi:MAG: DUF6508 domain-containing protein [bacterium]|nr:DUF6508 domain-containing protein [bacterium]
MISRNPTKREIAELVSYLSILYADGFEPVVDRSGCSTGENGVTTMTYPDYAEEVEHFFRLAARECWTDSGYSPAEAGSMLDDHEAIRAADLARIKTLLTYCVRGERFGDGFWETMIVDGHVRRLLERLAEIGSLDDAPPPTARPPAPRTRSKR